MEMLVLGGSWFVGRAIVSEALRRGWAVTTFRRGCSPGLPGSREVLGDRERPRDLERLAARGPWDVVVDVAGSVPRLVRDAARALRSKAGLYVFVSTVSAYRDWPQRPVDETSRLFEGDPDLDPGTRAWDPEAYGPLKAGCELAARREFGDHVLILRPTATLGPHEYVGRLQWWLRRMERGGRVLAPGDPKRGIQPIDVRDLAAFAVELAGRGAIGAYNAAAPIGRDSYGDLLEGCREEHSDDARTCRTSTVAPARLAELLALRDLTNPAAGQHAMQHLVSAIETAVGDAWRVRVRRDPGPRIVTVEDNYDDLRYPHDAVTRDRRYSRYVGDGSMLRSHPTAHIPALLDRYAANGEPDAVLSVPEICYRWDLIDRALSE